MQAYVISLAVGLFVGALYGLIGVRSPAPPMLALVGLLGILLGEQAVPLVKHALQAHPAVLIQDIRSRVCGRVPISLPKKDA